MEFKPEYYAVLEVLATGAKSVEEIADAVDVEPHDVETLLSALIGQGLVERRERGLLFKKEVYSLTEKGWQVLYQWRQTVKDAVHKAAEFRRPGKAEEADAVLAPVASLLPLLLTLGLLDMALYAAALGEPPPLDDVNHIDDTAEFDDVAADFGEEL